MNFQLLRNRTVGYLEEISIPFSTNLPLLDDDFDECIKLAPEVAQKIVVMYALTGLAHGADPNKLIEWLKENELDKDLSENELGYLTKKKLDKSDIITLSWGREALIVFAWCLGLLDELPFPYSEGDLEQIFQKIPPEVDVTNFLNNSTLIDIEKIIEKVDLYYCLHWAVKHPEVWNIKIETKFDKDIILERRRALEWIFSTQEYYDLILDT